MNTKLPTNQDSLSRYYRDLRVLMETITAKNGFANLGWLPSNDNHSTYHDAQHELVNFVTDKLSLKPGNSILEVGCGMGGPARATAKRLGVTVTGLELLLEQIEAGKLSSEVDNGTVSFVQGSAEAMPFESNSFDGVYSIESAFHYSDKQAFMREATRVVKPGARVAIADIVLPENWRGSWLERQLRRALSTPGFFSSDDYEQSAKENGLVLIDAFDLTSGVGRSLNRMALLIRKYWPQLRSEGYRASYLMTIYLVAKLSKYFYSLSPSQYMLFVFEKPDKRFKK